MLCANPVRVQGAEFPCRKCDCCRANAKRIWAARLVLEMGQHKFCSFITLTYAPEHLPEEGVSRQHIRSFLQRLRRACPPFRHFIAAEYSPTGRPHYHGLLFGVPYYAGRLVEEAWKLGFTQTAPPIHDSVRGYVTKYLFKDSGAPEGKTPVFSVKSPGLGKAQADAWATELLRLGKDDSYVPAVMGHGSRTEPLGPYLVRRMRKKLGGDGNMPKALEVAQLISKRDSVPVREEKRRKGAIKARQISSTVLGKRTLQ